MFKRVHSMLQTIFRQRGLNLLLKGVDVTLQAQGLRAFPTYEAVYKQCQALFKRQAGAVLAQELDPQDNSLTATYSRDDLVQMCDTLLSSPAPTDARDLSMLLAMTHTAGRGDDVRERRLCELTPPLQRSCIGEKRGWLDAVALHF
jgi:hypothetical protein